MDKNNFESKKYCCSNSARTETKGLGIIDVVLNIFALLGVIWLVDLVRNHSEYVNKELGTQNNTYNQFKGLLQTMDHNLSTTLLPRIVLCVIGIFVGALLFHAARTRNTLLLKIWTATTAIMFTISTIFFCAIIIRGESMTVLTIILIAHTLYVCYEVWIVLRLLKEIITASQVNMVEAINEEDC